MGTFDQILSTITYPLRVPFEIISWLKKASKNYGIMVLLLAITCYTYIGLRTYVDTTFAWFGQYMYGIQPGDIEAGIAISTMPWSFKMIYGLIFDNIPIMRRHTKPYLLVASALGVVAFAALSFDLFVPTWISFIAFVLVLQIGGAATDVLIDGLVVISGRESESGSSADLQVLSYASTGAGVIIGDLLGSFFAKPYETEGSKRLAQFKNNEVPESFVYGASTSSMRWYFRVMGIFPMFMFLLAIMQREPKSSVKISVRPILSNLAKLFKTLLFNPVVLKPMLWVYIYNMSKIKMTGAWKLYYTQVLGLTTMDLGYLNTGAAIFYIIGILSYGRFFMRVSYRKLFFRSQVFAIFIAFLSYAVVRRWNVAIGIPDFAFLMLTNCAEQMLGKLNSVPFLILAAQFCPEKMENTFFALLMSLFNFSDIQIPSIWSKAILDKFNIQGGNFTQFPTVVLINLFMGFIPLLLIFMVPTYSSILTAEERVELGLTGDSKKKIDDSIDSKSNFRDQETIDDKV